MGGGRDICCARRLRFAADDLISSENTSASLPTAFGFHRRSMQIVQSPLHDRPLEVSPTGIHASTLLFEDQQRLIFVDGS